MLKKTVMVAVSLTLFGGCGVFDPEARSKPVGSPDAAVPDASPPPDAEVVPTTILFTLPPVDPFYTPDPVTLQLYVFGADPERLELWRDGEPLAVLEPPYTYDWDTTIWVEGSYFLEARAVNGSTTVATDTQAIIVDRTAPTVLSFSPDADPEVGATEPIVVAFSEPIDLDRVTDDTFLLSDSLGGVLATTLVWSDNATTLTITPLPPGGHSSSQGFLSTGTLYDLAGNATAFNGTFSYPYRAEALCDDGTDDDSDLWIDCLDTDCNGIAGCEIFIELTCYDTFDNDADGFADCDDPDCASFCIAGCPTGSRGAMIEYSVGPLPDGGGFDFFPSVYFPELRIITGLALEISVVHSFDADVFFGLRAPDGTTITVVQDTGGAGDDFIDTFFIDSAPTSISDGSPPFTGSFRPLVPFSTLAGRPAGGSSPGFWHLTLGDDQLGETGTVTELKLYYCSCFGTSGCEFGFACEDGLDDDGDSVVDCDDADCATHEHCIPESVCDDGLDNDDDFRVDCADEDCDGSSGCEAAIELTCTDGFDNDADFYTDCADVNCFSTVWCQPETDCGDTVDNDGDGAADCDDPGCHGVGGCPVP